MNGRCNMRSNLDALQRNTVAYFLMEAENRRAILKLIFSPSLMYAI